MKKIIISLLIGGTLLGAGLLNMEPVNAAHKTVEYGGSWNYGSYLVWNGKLGYSNLASSFYWHSSSVTIGQGSALSGSVQPGIESRASRIGGYTARAYCYYNIW